MKTQIFLLLFEFSLKVIERSFDCISITSNWKSGSLLDNHVAYGQILCLLVYTLVSATHLFRKFHQNDECFKFLCGTYIRKTVTFVICILGFGGSAINLDLLINPRKANEALFLHILNRRSFSMVSKVWKNIFSILSTIFFSKIIFH